MKLGDLVTLRDSNGLIKAGTVGMIVKRSLWAGAPIWVVHWFGVQRRQQMLIMSKNLKVVKSVSSA